MKDFDINNDVNNERENENVTPTNETETPKDSGGDFEPIEIKRAENTNTPSEPQENSSNDNDGNMNNSSSPNAGANRTENPYFRGYGERPTEYPPRYNSYNNSNGNNDNNYNNSNNYNPNPNSYGYNSPVQNQGQISYAPVKPKKKSKPVTRGMLAAVLVAAVILAGGAGFGGAVLANRYTANNTPSYSYNSDNKINGTTPTGGNVVIYRNVDEVMTSTGTNGRENMTYAQVAALVKDSVVEITTEFNTTSRGWFNYVQQGAGSGVILTTDGYIITNAHVITKESDGSIADNITVRLTDASEHKATVVGYDSDADIAIIKIDATGLTAAQCGDSSKLTVGEELVIVGNPLGELGGTVTNGIVSATERELEVNGVKMSLIQTNAAVNPGNSGGGMFNMKGQLIGIVNAKSSGTDIEGLGFAIPVNDALNVSEQLLEYGYVRGKTMIGVTFSDISNNYYYYYNIQAGVYVDSLLEGYNDDVLQPGDRVVAVNGSTISSSSEIKAIITSSSVGDKLKFQVERKGKLMDVEVECFEKVPGNQNNIEFEDKQSGPIDEDGNVSPYPSEPKTYYSPDGGSLSDFFERFFNN